MAAGGGIFSGCVMSIIPSLAELFRRSAVPSIESTLGQGGSREHAISNLQRLVGEGTTISQQTIGTAIARVQTALQRGAAIERGENVPRQLIPIDPTIPIGTEFRYRVKVTVDIPNPLNPSDIQTITTVIPIDSESELSRQQILDMARQGAERFSPREPSPKFRVLGAIMQTQEIVSFTAEIVSVYRSPVG